MLITPCRKGKRKSPLSQQHAVLLKLILRILYIHAQSLIYDTPVLFLLRNNENSGDSLAYLSAIGQQAKLAK